MKNEPDYVKVVKLLAVFRAGLKENQESIKKCKNKLKLQVVETYVNFETNRHGRRDEECN